MGYEQEERYEDLRERNEAPDMYGSRRNYATRHNPRRNESEFMHRERTPEPRCRQEQRTAWRSDPLIVLVQGLLDSLDHRTGESSERRQSSPPDYLKMVTLIKKFGTVRYPGGTDPFETSTWLRNLEKNIRAIPCPNNFKKDYPLNNNVDWLSTKIELLQQDLDTICKKDQQPATSIDVYTITSLDAKISAMDDRLQTYEDMHDRFANSFSIDRLQGPWIDGKNPVELLPYTAAEVDKITSKICTAIDTMEERLDKCCDDIYFPFDKRIGGLDSHTKWLQKEVKAIQRQLAAQHQISTSIDRKRAKSLDGKSPRSTDEHLIASIDTESTPASEQLIHKTIESVHEELTEILAYAYDNIGWHQVSIDNVQDRLHNISNVLKKMDDKWTRNGEASRSSLHLGPECAEMKWMLVFQQAVVYPPNSQSLPQSSLMTITKR
ncbi:hypothetical protein IGI04_019948 [Brassica rapa subsp. trilocularis]|uniref:Uncharacterized protein n=1 Tax=Brassica rapa subsp. trilocularis TaxID=1813537 RepID=A0ABQ7MHD5_BRACM|nr:hypothetical protein IGI04_019948 [Brassica rapa subsp. trilocularis]